MRYEDMSNLELNVALASAMGRFAGYVMHNHREVKLKLSDSPFLYEEVDFCTNWNATMPLAVEHGVTYRKGSRVGDLYIANCKIESESNGVTSLCYFFGEDNNLLRAIVICLIEVLEGAKND